MESSYNDFTPIADTTPAPDTSSVGDMSPTVESTSFETTEAGLDSPPPEVIESAELSLDSPPPEITESDDVGLDSPPPEVVETAEAILDAIPPEVVESEDNSLDNPPPEIPVDTGMEQFDAPPPETIDTPLSNEAEIQRFAEEREQFINEQGIDSDLQNMVEASDTTTPDFKVTMPDGSEVKSPYGDPSTWQEGIGSPHADFEFAQELARGREIQEKMGGAATAGNATPSDLSLLDAIGQTVNASQPASDTPLGEAETEWFYTKHGHTPYVDYIQPDNLDDKGT